MKIPSSSPPRFTCRVVRAWSSIADSASRSRHVAGCPGCQHYFAACTELESSLRRTAVHQQPAVPAGLEQRIMQAIDQVERVAVPAVASREGWDPNALKASVESGASSKSDHTLGAARSTSRLLLISLAGAAAGVALAVFLLPKLNPPENTAPTATTPPVADAPVVAEGSLQERLLAQIAPAGALLQKNPLQDEVDSVYSDARSAVHFLALNFLPNAPERIVRRPNQPATS